MNRDNQVFAAGLCMVACFALGCVMGAMCASPACNPQHDHHHCHVPPGCCSEQAHQALEARVKQCELAILRSGGTLGAANE